jgi:hypothetical protein
MTGCGRDRLGPSHRHSMLRGTGIGVDIECIVVEGGAVGRRTLNQDPTELVAVIDSPTTVSTAGPRFRRRPALAQFEPWLAEHSLLGSARHPHREKKSTPVLWRSSVVDQERYPHRQIRPA